MISTAIVLSSVGDTTVFGDAGVDTEFEQDREIFRAVAGWTLTSALIGVFALAICTIFRFLFYFEIVIHHFGIFGAVVRMIYHIKLLLHVQKIAIYRLFLVEYSSISFILRL